MLFTLPVTLLTIGIPGVGRTAHSTGIGRTAYSTHLDCACCAIVALQSSIECNGGWHYRVTPKLSATTRQLLRQYIAAINWVQIAISSFMIHFYLLFIFEQVLLLLVSQQQPDTRMVPTCTCSVMVVSCQSQIRRRFLPVPAV